MFSFPPVHNDFKGTPPLGLPTPEEIDLFHGSADGLTLSAATVLVGRGRSAKEAARIVLDYRGRASSQTSTGGWCGDAERAFLDALFAAPDRSSK